MFRCWYFNFKTEGMIYTVITLLLKPSMLFLKPSIKLSQALSRKVAQCVAVCWKTVMNFTDTNEMEKTM